MQALIPDLADCRAAIRGCSTEASTSKDFARASFPLARINFSYWSERRFAGGFPRQTPLSSGEAQAFRSHIDNSFADSQRGGGRWRRNIQHVQHFAGWDEAEVIYQSTVRCHRLGSHS